MAESKLEKTLAHHISLIRQIPEPAREYLFAASMGRRWRADFAWPEHRLLVEVEGGTWTGGRHTRGGGFRDDCEKYNAATMLGWRVLRFTGSMIKSGEAVNMIEKALCAECDDDRHELRTEEETCERN